MIPYDTGRAYSESAYFVITIHPSGGKECEASASTTHALNRCEILIGQRIKRQTPITYSCIAVGHGMQKAMQQVHLWSIPPTFSPRWVGGEHFLHVGVGVNRTYCAIFCSACATKRNIFRFKHFPLFFKVCGFTNRPWTACIFAKLVSQICRLQRSWNKHKHSIMNVYAPFFGVFFVFFFVYETFETETASLLNGRKR